MSIKIDPRLADWTNYATPACFARLASQGQWVAARHLGYLDDAVCDAITGRGHRRLLVTMPPRHGKSEYCSYYLPAWFLLTNPGKRVLLLSHTASLSKVFGRRVRDLVEQYAWLFGTRIRQDTRASDQWELESGGGMITAGVGGGAVTGRGGHLIIVDDPIRNSEDAMSQTYREKLWEWWQSTIQTRQEPDAVFVVIQTRWHKDDLAGQLIRQGGWFHVNFAALAEEVDLLGRKPGEPLWPERISQDMLADIRLRTSPYWWSCLYQQTPMQHDKAEWPEEYFKDILAPAWPEACTAVAMAIDPAQGKHARKGDYSSIATVGLKDGILYADVTTARMDVPTLCRKVCELYRAYNPQAIGLEANVWQSLLSGEINNAASAMGLPPLPITLINNQTRKELRIYRLGPYLANKTLKIVDHERNRQLLEQLRAFPLGDYDDAPDALEMAIRTLGWLLGRAP